MKITEVDEANIADAGRIHSESWKESHRSFCCAEFVEKHTPAAQVEYLRREMNVGKSIYMLIDGYPVGIVSVYGSLIENLYVLPSEQRKGYGSQLLNYAIRQCSGTPSLACLIVNSGVVEHDKATGQELPPQFEVNLPISQMQELLEKTFAGWHVIKHTVVHQKYDIPRVYGIADLETNVVTYVVRKEPEQNG